jgi:hypothetical protein
VHAQDVRPQLLVAERVEAEDRLSVPMPDVVAFGAREPGYGE